MSRGASELLLTLFWKHYLRKSKMAEAKQDVEVEVGRAPPAYPVTGISEKIGDEARRATEIEHHMSFWEGLKLYPTAVGWSAFFSMGVIMTAFDPQLLGSLFATPAFQKDFGYLYNDPERGPSYIVSAPWQTALSMGNPIGQVVGALFAGIPMEMFGRRRVSL